MLPVKIDKTKYKSMRVVRDSTDRCGGILLTTSGLVLASGCILVQTHKQVQRNSRDVELKKTTNTEMSC